LEVGRIELATFRRGETSGVDKWSALKSHSAAGNDVDSSGDAERQTGASDPPASTVNRYVRSYGQAAGEWLDNSRVRIAVGEEDTSCSGEGLRGIEVQFGDIETTVHDEPA